MDEVNRKDDINKWKEQMSNIVFYNQIMSKVNIPKSVGFVWLSHDKPTVKLAFGAIWTG